MTSLSLPHRWNLMLLLIIAVSTVLWIENFESLPTVQARFSETLADNSFVNSSVSPIITDTHKIAHLPIVLQKWPPIPPAKPTLNPIVNPDGDNAYEVTWSSVADAQSYLLEVGTSAEFANKATAYEGPGMGLHESGRIPYTYYYHVKAINRGGSSEWSNIQSITVYPLHVGLSLKWDGTGDINFGYSEKVGYHQTLHLDKMMDADTVQASWKSWYDPNPEDLDSSSFYSYYSVSTGKFVSSTEPEDPVWKWGSNWRLGYQTYVKDGQTIYIDGQPFTVHGPLFGPSPTNSQSYWEFINQNKFLIYDDGQNTQYVLPGEAILRYDTGSYRIQIYENIRRVEYYLGADTGYWVRYIVSLTEFSNDPLKLTVSTPAIDSQRNKSPLDPWQAGLISAMK